MLMPMAQVHEFGYVRFWMDLSVCSKPGPYLSVCFPILVYFLFRRNPLILILIFVWCTFHFSMKSGAVVGPGHHEAKAAARLLFACELPSTVAAEDTVEVSTQGGHCNA